MQSEEARSRDFGAAAVTSARTVRASVGAATTIWIGAIPEWPNAQTEHEC